MDSGRTHAALPMPLVESNGEENIRGLRAAIGEEWFVGSALKIGIVQIDVRNTMPPGRKVDQPAAFTEKRRKPVDEDKVAEMIGAELRFKTVHRVAKGSGHHACVRDNCVKELPLG